MNRNFRDIAVRAAKTFAQAALSVLMVKSGLWIPAALVGVLSALVSVGMNFFNIAPTSITGRAAATFLQTFLATFAAAGYVINEAILVAAFAAAFSATMNMIKETY